MKTRIACLAILASALMAAPAFAQSDDMAPARLAQLDQRAAEMKLPFTHVKAIDIARGKGLVTVKEIKLTKRGNWKLEGADTTGRKMEMRIDGKSEKVELE